MDIPIELFGIFVGISAFMAILGLIRQPQIPAMITFGGMFLLVISMSTTNIVFGQLLDETTTHQNSVNWFFRTDNWVGGFNGAGYATASANTVYDITTQDFWTSGMFKRTSDSGIAEVIITKKIGISTFANGYIVYINTSDQLVAGIANGAGITQTSSALMAITLDTWYAWGASYDRDGNLTLYLYNMDTGILTNTSVNISARSASITNTETFHISRVGTMALNFFNGYMDMLIPPQTGLLTENQFSSWITDGDFGALPTFNNLYEFELNLNDSVGSNTLTNNGVSFVFQESELVVSDLNTYTPNNYEFTELPKAVMGLISVVLMLTGAMMVFKNE